MIGTKFSRLLVVSELPRVHYKTSSSRLYLCLCDCGNYVNALPSNLKRGATKSCGCLKAETAHLIAKTHGKSKSDEYKIWAGVIKRCTNNNYKEWHLYGGRGISFDQSWRKFENFYSDMGPRPSKNHSIDRSDPNGNYCKENCYWANDIQQGLTKRKTNKISYNGKTFSIRQFAINTGISYQTIYCWIVRKKFSESELLNKINSLSGISLEPKFQESLKIHRPSQ